MKKLIKNLVIFILVISAVGGTAWFFYSKLTEKRNSYNVSINYQYSASNNEFSALMSNANSASQCNRFGDLILIHHNLDKVSEVLIPYLALSEETDVNQNKIYSYLQSTKNMQPSLTSMFVEYKSKAEKVATFPKQEGANPVYSKLCDYNIQYAKYLKVVNHELGYVVNRDADSKFYVIELYLNVVINTLQNTQLFDGVTKLTNPEDVTVAGGLLSFNNGYMNDFGASSTMFRKSYKSCDKNLIATDFATKFNSINSLNDSSENNAIYYLKQMLGVI